MLEENYLFINGRAAGRTSMLQLLYGTFLKQNKIMFPEWSLGFQTCKAYKFKV